jgi:hypothetical protein
MNGPVMDPREFRLHVLASELERATRRAEQAEAHLAVLTRASDEVVQKLEAEQSRRREEVDTLRRQMVSLGSQTSVHVRYQHFLVCVCAQVAWCGLAGALGSCGANRAGRRSGRSVFWTVTHRPSRLHTPTIVHAPPPPPVLGHPIIAME